jgi:tRNA(Ile)-lysidine synthase
VLPDLVRNTVEAHHLLGRGDRIVVAVSGGPDSVALLDVLAQMREEWRLTLCVAHLNHQLRVEADEEAEFVRALAAEYDSPVIIESTDVRALAASEKRSLEHAARNARRAFLVRAARSAKANRIALGHHADDRVETVLMRILRGTGIDGLAGIRPIAGPFIRPLFDVTQAQVMAYIEERALPYREDPSNRDPAFLRNRVRRELLPLLERLQPGCKRAILRLSELAWQDRSWLFVEAWTLLVPKVLIEETPKRMTLRLSSLSRIVVPAARARVVREAMHRLLGHTTDIEHGHVAAVLRLADRGKTGAQVHLPHKLTAERGYGTLILRVGKVKPGEPVGEFVLTVPGETEIAPLGITIIAELISPARASLPAAEPPHVAQLDYAAMEEPLILRTWRRGDRLQPLGMTGSVKVHDLFVNHKVPRAERERVPIITAAGSIAWIVGLRVDERFKVSAATETVLRLEARATNLGAHESAGRI